MLERAIDAYETRLRQFVLDKQKSTSAFASYFTSDDSI